MKTLLKLLLPLSIAASASASTAYDVVAGFSGTANPNTPWSYYYDLASLTAYDPSTQSVPNCLGAGTQACWNDGLLVPDTAVIYANTTGSTFTSGSTSIPNDYIGTDPESLGTEIQFAVPTTGNYSISGNFYGADTGENSHPVEIFDNSTMIFSGTVSTPGATTTFSLSSLSLNAGDVIAFEVLTGTSGCTYCALSTGLQADVTLNTSSSVPEPSSFLLAGGALAGALLRRVLRRT